LRPNFVGICHNLKIILFPVYFAQENQHVYLCSRIDFGAPVKKTAIYGWTLIKKVRKVEDTFWEEDVLLDDDY